MDIIKQGYRAHGVGMPHYSYILDSEMLTDKYHTGMNICACFIDSTKGLIL